MKKKDAEDKPRKRGRPRMPGIEPMSIRITKDTKDRINALDGPNRINEFIREAIDRELKRRERQTREG